MNGGGVCSSPSTCCARESPFPQCWGCWRLTCFRALHDDPASGGEYTQRHHGGGGECLWCARRMSIHADHDDGGLQRIEAVAPYAAVPHCSGRRLGRRVCREPLGFYFLVFGSARSELRPMPKTRDQKPRFFFSGGGGGCWATTGDCGRTSATVGGADS